MHPASTPSQWECLQLADCLPRHPRNCTMAHKPPAQVSPPNGSVHKLLKPDKLFTPILQAPDDRPGAGGAAGDICRPDEGQRRLRAGGAAARQPAAQGPPLQVCATPGRPFGPFPIAVHDISTTSSASATSGWSQMAFHALWSHLAFHALWLKDKPEVPWSPAGTATACRRWGRAPLRMRWPNSTWRLARRPSGTSRAPCPQVRPDLQLVLCTRTCSSLR